MRLINALIWLLSQQSYQTKYCISQCVWYSHQGSNVNASNMAPTLVLSAQGGPQVRPILAPWTLLSGHPWNPLFYSIDKDLNANNQGVLPLWCIIFYKYRYSHQLEETVLQPYELYDWNPYTWNDDIYFEAGPGFSTGGFGSHLSKLLEWRQEVTFANGVNLPYT